jgi:hypothetical protein
MAGWGRCRRCGARIYWGTSPYNPDKAFPFDDEDESESHFETCGANEYVTDAGGERQRVGQCKACKGKVFFETTWSGARRPMDVDDVYSCHFDTCPGEPARYEQREDIFGGRRGAPRPEPEPASAMAYSRRNPGTMSDWMRDLMISPPLSRELITSSFRKLCMTHHPDMGGTNAAFIRLKWAYDRLKEQVA